MAQRIVIKNLTGIQDINKQARSAVWGRGVSNSFLFRSASGSPQSAFNLNIDTLEINNYDITNNIDTLIQQTNNQLQLSTINVAAGDGAAINIASNQGLSGSNRIA